MYGLLGCFLSASAALVPVRSQKPLPAGAEPPRLCGIAAASPRSGPGQHVVLGGIVVGCRARALLWLGYYLSHFLG